MKMTIRFTLGLLVVLTVLLTASLSRAQSVYDNTTGLTTNVLILTNGQSVGEEIFLANTGTYPLLTNFIFEYYSPNTSFAGTVQGDVQFYENNGPLTNGYAAPGTLFYDTGLFGLSAPYSISGTNAILFSLNASDLYSTNALLPINLNFVPSDFTVVYTFQGLTNTDSIGLPIFGPPAVGTNYGDYWVTNASGWTLVTNTAGYVEFGQKLSAAAFPQPVIVSNTTVTAYITTISFTTTNASSYTTNGFTYVLHYTNSAGLTAPVSTWPASTNTVIGDGAIHSIQDISTDPNRFYRIAVQ